MTDTSTLRAFLAFDIPDKVREELFKMVGVMAKMTDGIRWGEPNNLHCTLKFFGNLEKEKLMTHIAPAIEKATVSAKPFFLQSAGLGVFPNFRYPRVVWAGFSGETAAVVNLYEHVEETLKQFDVPKDERAFRLHLTLGRVKGKVGDAESLSHFIEKQVGTMFGDVPVDHLTLYQSVLSRKGSISTPLKIFPLRGAPLGNP